MSKPDPIVAALEAASNRPYGSQSKIDLLYGDRPEILEAIKSARVDKGLSTRVIADTLSQQGVPISRNAVEAWLKKQGIR